MRSIFLFEIHDLSLDYGDYRIIDSLNLSLAKGEFLTILGKSGSGKSSLLRAIAGFETITEGSIVLYDQCISKRGYHLPPERRSIGMMFQDIALFPHLTVEQNITFGLYALPKEEQSKRADELLDLINLVEYKKSYPHQLSGGQQQRVALARSIAPKPKLLLLDEPFIGLEYQLQTELLEEMVSIFKSENITAILVSHNQKEVFSFSDKIAVLNQGRFEQIGTPYEVYHEPCSKFVAQFIAQGDFLPATIISDNQIRCALGTLSTHFAKDYKIGEEVFMLIRPEDLLHAEGSPLQGKIIRRYFRGTHFLYRIILPTGEELSCFCDSHHNHAVGDFIEMNINMDHLLLFKKDS